MKYDQQEIERRLRLGEDSAWEFKEIEFKGDRLPSSQRTSLMEEIDAFANSDGGVLLCGVSDDGAIQGMSRVQLDTLERAVVEICSDSITPSIHARMLREEVKGKMLLLVDVPQGYALHETPAGSFARVGSSKRKLDSDKRMRLAQQRGQARFHWFDEQAVPETGFGSLDLDLWKPLLSAEGASSPQIALEKMGLLRADRHGKIRATVAGLLICSNRPRQWLPSAYITATHYRGNDRASGQTDAQTIDGPIQSQIVEALAFARRNMAVGARKDPAREDLPQYSEQAIFEALVNAVVHRDYQARGDAIRLSMFADRMEIRSPGGLPNTLTVESMGERQSTRNEVLSSALGRMPVGDDSRVGAAAGGRRYFMERRGDGVSIIKRETQRLCGRLPNFRLIDNAELCVTLPAAPVKDAPAKGAVTVRCAGKPVANAELLAIFPNKTWRRAATDDLGGATLALHTAKLPMTVFVAAAGHASGRADNWLPEHGALAVEIKPLPGGGSIIFPKGDGELPGLSGRLNPILDTVGRTYLYASNIAIEDGKPQPANFRFGEDLRLTDANGRDMIVRIMSIEGDAALVEYEPPRDS